MLSTFQESGNFMINRHLQLYKFKKFTWWFALFGWPIGCHGCSCVSLRSSLHSVRFWQRIVNIIKVYIERNNKHVPNWACPESHFGTCHIGTSMVRDCITVLSQVTMYRQFARKVGPSANAALIRYSSHRLWLCRLTRNREWTNG